MKQRFGWLLRLYIVFVAIFAAQKVAFMLIDAPQGSAYGLRKDFREPLSVLPAPPSTAG